MKPGLKRLTKQGLFEEVRTPRHWSYFSLTYPIKRDGCIHIAKHRAHLVPEEHIAVVCDVRDGIPINLLGMPDGFGSVIGDPMSIANEVIEVTPYHRLMGSVLCIHRVDGDPRVIRGDAGYLRELAREVIQGMSKDEREGSTIYIGLLAVTDGFSELVEQEFRPHTIPNKRGVEWDIVLREYILPN